MEDEPGGLHDALHNAGKVSGIEQVMWLGWHWQQLLADGCVDVHRGRCHDCCQGPDHIFKVGQLE